MNVISAFKQKWELLPKKQKIALILLFLFLIILPITLSLALNEVRSRSKAAYVVTPPTPPTPPDPTPQPPALSVTLVTPNGGETLIKNQNYRITWTSGSGIDKVTLGYSKGPGDLNWIANNIPNTGYYDWKVFVGNTTATQFKIKIIAYQTGVGSIQDDSDNYFTVTTTASPTPTPNPSPLALTLTSPNGGEVWTRGNTYNISWNQIQPSISTSLHIYTRNIQNDTDKYIGAIAYNVSHLAGVNNYSWKIPPFDGPSSTPPDGNNIIVSVVTRDAKGSVVTSDKSNNPFTITSFSPSPSASPSASPSPKPTPPPISTNTPPFIKTTRLPTGRVNRRYQALIYGTDVNSKDYLNFTSINLPPGIEQTSCRRINFYRINTLICYLKGSPTQVSTHNITLILDDSQGGVTNKKLRLAIRP